MALDSKSLSEILDKTGEFFICLRCGECCYRWAVSFSNGYKKRENEKCPYLEELKIENNSFYEAFCKIYKERPEQCRRFKISFATVCPIGLWKWSKILEKEGPKSLPERIRKVFEFLKENGENKES